MNTSEHDRFTSPNALLLAIEQIHQMNAQRTKDGKPAYLLTIAVTGAAGHFGGYLCDVAGASNSLYRFCIDYSRSASSGEMGYTPPSYVSHEVAIDLARGCQNTAMDWVQKFGLPPPGVTGNPTPLLIGVGLTGSVATNGVPGPGKAHLALVNPDGSVRTTFVAFEGDTWTRQAQNALCEILLLNLILEALGLNQIEINKDTFPGVLTLSHGAQ